MTNEKYRIREICGDWALDIPFPGSVVTIFFNSRANAELVKKILIHEDAHPGEAVPFKQDYFPDTTKMVPLTLEQLREKINEPVYLYIYDTALASGWHILKTVTEDKIIFRGRNTVYVPISSIGKCFDLYSYPSAHIDREAWKPCELCGGDKLDGVGFADHFGLRVYLSGGTNKPPENERFQFCPKCGRPLTPEAWAMLEKRLRG